MRGPLGTRPSELNSLTELGRRSTPRWICDGTCTPFHSQGERNLRKDLPKISLATISPEAPCSPGPGWVEAPM